MEKSEEKMKFNNENINGKSKRKMILWNVIVMIASSVQLYQGSLKQGAGGCRDRQNRDIYTARQIRERYEVCEQEEYLEKDRQQ